LRADRHPLGAERAAREYVADQGGLIFNARRPARAGISPEQLAPVLQAIRQPLAAPATRRST
jgi:hypothetical protein